MNRIEERDTLFETARHLDFNNLRYLCQTNRLYSNICREERFQTLIRQRYDEMISEKVNDDINRLKTSSEFTSRIKFNLVKASNVNQSHQIEFIKDYRGLILITERLQNLDYSNSIIYRYAKNLLNFAGFENITQEQYEQFVDDPRLNKSHYSDLQLINDIDFLFQKLNLKLYGTNSTSFYNVRADIINRLTLEANNVQPQSLIDILTLIYKSYPNAEVEYYV